jgi:hypothetical protein
MIQTNLFKLRQRCLSEIEHSDTPENEAGTCEDKSATAPR